MPESLDQAQLLSVLTRARSEEVKAFADGILARLKDQDLDVLENRTGLVMVSSWDSAQGSVFHVGEVLVSEAKVRLGNVIGYGMCVGMDLEKALAIAILDAAHQASLFQKEISEFFLAQKARQAAEDEEMLKHVSTTRVEMENF